MMCLHKAFPFYLSKAMHLTEQVSRVRVGLLLYQLPVHPARYDCPIVTSPRTLGGRCEPWASMASAMSQASTAQWRCCSTCWALRRDTSSRSLGFSHALIDGVMVLSRCQSSLQGGRTVQVPRSSSA